MGWWLRRGYKNQTSETAKDNLWRKQKGKCKYCHRQMTKKRGRAHSMTIDHVTALSRNGTNRQRNKVLACRQCNVLKANWSTAEFLALYPGGSRVVPNEKGG